MDTYRAFFLVLTFKFENAIEKNDIFSFLFEFLLLWIWLIWSKLYWNVVGFSFDKNFLLNTWMSRYFLKRIQNACTQEAIRFLKPNTKLSSCVQTAIRFSQRNKKFRIVHKLPFILWLRNTKFLKLFQKGHLLFDNKVKNLKLHANWHSFFDHERQNLKPYPNGHSFFNRDLNRGCLVYMFSLRFSRS